MMKPRRFAKIICRPCLLFSLLTCSLLFAEQAELPKDPSAALELETLTVTGTPLQRRVSDVSSTVSIIDEEAIDASNANYVMDMIDQLPGVYVRKEGIYGRHSIELRGLGSNCRRIQTLVDGRPEKMSLFGCTVTQTLPLANVERIEVVRGPEAVLYGSDAMGGVVNIITKRRHDEGFESSVLGSYGSNSSFHSLLRHGGKIGAFDYYGSYDRKETNGHRANSAYEADFGSLRLGYQLDEIWRAELSGQFFRDRGEDPGPVTAPYTNDDVMKYKRWSWNANVLGNWDNGNAFSFTLYNNSGVHRFHMPSIDDYWYSDDRSTGTLTKLSLTLYEDALLRNVLTLGHDYQYQWAKPRSAWVRFAKVSYGPGANFMDFGPYSTHSHDFFAFNELSIGPLINTLGLRMHYDDHRREWEALPQLGLLWHLSDDTALRGKIGKGFRLAKYSELHLFPAHNEKLKPEEVWSYELGLTHELTKWLGLAVTGFYMDVRNEVQTVPNAKPPPASININSDSYAIRGIESTLSIKPCESLQAELSYTYMNIDDPSNSNHANRQGKPESVFNGLVSYQWRQLRLSLEGKYITGLYDANVYAGSKVEKVDDFFVANAKLSYQMQQNVELFAGIDNLFDKKYEEVPGYVMPGITAFCGMKVTF
jgi:vitamin B12 transporter